MIRPANSPAQADPVSRRATITTSPAATVMKTTEGMRMIVGVEPTAIQQCSSR